MQSCEREITGDSNPCNVQSDVENSPNLNEDRSSENDAPILSTRNDLLTAENNENADLKEIEISTLSFNSGSDSSSSCSSSSSPSVGDCTDDQGNIDIINIQVFSESVSQNGNHQELCNHLNNNQRTNEIVEYNLQQNGTSSFNSFENYDDSLLLRLLESAEAGINSRPCSIYHQPPKAADRSAAQRLAKRLYNLEGFKMRDVPKHLIKRNEFSQLVGEEYLNFFEFTGLTLDHAIREFFSKFILFGETSDRERILQFFSRRYFLCNPTAYASEASCHYLTCALVLLNADLHSQIPKKMTCAEFIANLAMRNEGQNFSREELRDLYNSIKNECIQWPNDYDQTDVGLNNSSIGDVAYPQTVSNPSPSLHHQTNPYHQTNLQKEGREFMRGFLARKCVMECHGKRVRKLRRGWKSYYARLKGYNLLLYRTDDSQKFESAFNEGSQWSSSVNIPISSKTPLVNSILSPNTALDCTLTDEEQSKSSVAASSSILSNQQQQSVGVSSSLPEAEYCLTLLHSFTWRDINYTKKPNVFRIRLHSGAEMLFNTYGSVEMQHWIAHLNYSASLFSPPVRPCPVSSQKGFHRPTYSLIPTPFNDRQQLESHISQLSYYMNELTIHEKNAPSKASKAKQRAEFEEKLQFLRDEVERLKIYTRLLEVHLNGWDINAALNSFNNKSLFLKQSDLKPLCTQMLFPTFMGDGDSIPSCSINSPPINAAPTHQTSSTLLTDNCTTVYDII